MLIGRELDSGEYTSPIDRDSRLDDDIRRISEKIDNMSTSHRREYNRRVENEKYQKEEFRGGRRMMGYDDSTYRLTESDYVARPLVPMRSPHRTPLRSPDRMGMEGRMQTHPPGNAFSTNGHYAEERSGWV